MRRDFALFLSVLFTLFLSISAPFFSFRYKKQPILLMVIAISTLSCFTAEAAPKWRTAYLANTYTDPNSLVYQPLSAVPWGKYTHVIQSAIFPTAIDGVPGINTCNYYIACDPVGTAAPIGNAQAFVDAAHTGGAKALVSIIVGNDAPSPGPTQATDMTINTSPANVDTFVQVLVGFLNKYGYDGIDIDWEGHAPSDNGNDHLKISATTGAPSATIIYSGYKYDDGGAHLILYYTITATNTGATTASGVSVIDNLPVGLTFASSSDTCSNSSGMVTCNVGDLASGASATRTFAVDISDEIQFPQFVRKLRTALGPDKVITVFSPEERALRSTHTDDNGTIWHAYDIVDQINFGNYDNDSTLSYSGAPSPTTWFNTAVRMDPNWGFATVHNKTQEENLMYAHAYWGGTIPFEKLGLGVPFYGYVRQAPLDAMHGVTAPLQTYADPGIGTTPYIRSPIAFSQLITPRCIDPADPYGPGIPPVSNPPPLHCADGSPLQSRTLTNSLPGSATSPGLRAWVPFYDPIFKRIWDNTFKAPYVSYTAGAAEDAFVTYTDPQQIQESVKLAKEQGLGGMMVFAINQEYLPDQAGDDRYPLTMSMATDLVVTASTNVSQVYVNGQIVYTVVVSNNGPAMASGVIIADPLPSGMTYISANATQGSCSNASGTVSCNVGVLGSGASTTITITATPTVAGNVTNKIAVTGDDYDPNLSNNAASVTTTVNPLTDLAIAIAGSPSPVTLGQSITYTISVINNGPSIATNVATGGTLPSCTTADLGTLSSGQTKTCTRTVTPSTVGTFTQTVSVSGAETDPKTSNNSATLSITVQAPDLTPTAMSASKSGKKVSVSDTVKNQGNSSAGSFSVGYYLSKDTAYSTDDLPLMSTSGGSTPCTRSVSSLGVGTPSSVSNKTCYKPSNTVTDQKYYVLVVDDQTKQVIESNESNNTSASTGTVWW